MEMKRWIVKRREVHVVECFVMAVSAEMAEEVLDEKIDNGDFTEDMVKDETIVVSETMYHETVEFKP